MRPVFCLTLLSVVVFFPLAGCSKKAADDGTKPFQGTWDVVAEGGKKAEQQFYFEKDTVHVQIVKNESGKTSAAVGGSSVVIPRSAFRVDTSKTPAQIDFVPIEGENQGKTRDGIFEMNDKNLKICIADYEEPRPAAFTAKEKVTILNLQRVQ